MSADNDTPDREKRVTDLLHAAARTGRAPDSLQAQVAAMRERAAESPRRAPRRPAFFLPRLALPVAAAIAAALVLVLGGGAGAPSIAQAASLASLQPTASGPGPDPSAPTKLLSAKVGSLHFPNWQDDGGWRTSGQRTDRVGDRTATTVYYALGSRRVVYSIVSSPTLPGLHLHGEPYETIFQHGRTTVVWEEAGHTCLLTASGLSPVRLWQLAAFGSHRVFG